MSTSLSSAASRASAPVLVGLLVVLAGCGPRHGVPERRGDDMVQVPAGVFTMGCRPEQPACEPDAQPARAVHLRAFAIDRFEVTSAEYVACVEAGGCSQPVGTEVHPSSHPVSVLNYREASAFCAWAGKRLPTEAEWEKAARGTDGRIYPWGDDPPDCDRAVYTACWTSKHDEVFMWTAPVGSHARGVSPYGIHDMAGNVAEWVSDYYAADYYDGAPDTDPAGPASGELRVQRGAPGTSDQQAYRRLAMAEDVLVPFHSGVRCARDARP
jgi:formylglycine-generating enzyme required for sulfatase activity